MRSSIFQFWAILGHFRALTPKRGPKSKILYINFWVLGRSIIPQEKKILAQKLQEEFQINTRSDGHTVRRQTELAPRNITATALHAVALKIIFASYRSNQTSQNHPILIIKCVFCFVQKLNIFGVKRVVNVNLYILDYIMRNKQVGNHGNILRYGFTQLSCVPPHLPHEISMFYA